MLGIGSALHQVGCHEDRGIHAPNGPLEQPESEAVGRRNRRWLDAHVRRDGDRRVVDDGLDSIANAGHGVTGKDAQVHHGLGHGRQDVGLGAPLEHGDRRRGANARCRCRIVEQGALHERAEEPPVGEGNAHAEGKVVPQEGEVAVHGTEVRGEGMTFEAHDRRGENARRRVRRGLRRMPSRRLHVEMHVHVTLLGGADHRDRRVESRDQAVGDGAALVEDELELDPIAAEMRCYLCRTITTADLLVVSESKVHRAGRALASREERLHGLHECHHRELVIHGAPAPDDAIDHRAAEGRMDPVVGGRRVHGYHVHVPHEENGFEPGIATLEAVDEAVVVDHAALAHAVNVRILRRQVAVEGQERLRVELAAVVVGDCREAERRAEALGQRRGVELNRRDAGCVGALPIGEGGVRPQEQQNSQGEGRQGKGKQLFHVGQV